MLKLTNSFCRYLTVTCERVDYKSHVNKYSHLSRIREARRASCVDFKLKRPFNCYVNFLKHSMSKKRAKAKRNKPNLDRTEQMNENAEGSHTSYGGTFVVSSDDSSDEEWKRKPYRPRATKTKVPLNFRCWENLISSEDENGFKFKVVSYNVLAQYLLDCHAYLYTKCSTKNLKWPARSARIFDEIITLAPDVLCLQEVQVNHLSTFYSRFEKIGYRGVFKQKTSDKQDGCAIYYRTSKFTIEDHTSVEFLQPNLRILNRDNIGLMVKLVPRRNPYTPLVVATTHLLYNPKRPDVKLAQIQVFLAEIDRFAFYKNGTESGHLPIILTGDFNSTPDSEVVNLLTYGHACKHKTQRMNSDWERIGVTDNCQHLSVYLNRRAGRDTEFDQLQIYNSDYSESPPEHIDQADGDTPGPFNLLFNSGDLWQTLQFESVYKRLNSDDDKHVTTFQNHWVTVDYMYFSRCTNLWLTDRLRLPSAEECEVLKRLPNEVFASDHLALAAVFVIIPKPPIGKAEAD